MTEIKELPELEALIKSAFSGVTLGKGVSMGQADVMDNWGCDSKGKILTERDLKALRERENTHNWQTLTETDLAPGMSFMDAAGYRYYLPAFIVSTLHGGYTPETIHYLSGYYLRRSGFSWQYFEYWTSLLDGKQKHAIAQFLYWLPYNLNFVYQTRRVNAEIEEALQNYWGQYLDIDVEA